jgi:hypothetical protein
MTNPITPPPELVQQWGHDANLLGVPHNDENWAYEQHIANRAAQWGATQELEACCDWLHWQNLATHADLIPSLRAARRPKSPSLKEQALMALEDGDTVPGASLTSNEVDIIRRALEALPDSIVVFPSQC